MPKEWEGGVRAKKGHLYIRFFKDGQRREKAVGVADTPEGRAEAEAMLESIRGKLKAQDGIRAAVGDRTVSEYAKSWLDNRTGYSVAEYRHRLKDHVLPIIGHLALRDVKAGDIRRMVMAIEQKKATRPGPWGDGNQARVQTNQPLAPRTVRGIYAVASAMFRDAVIDGMIDASPCVLYGAHLPSPRDKNPTWRDTAVFEAWEVSMLVSDHRIPLDRRAMYALMFLGCCRFGEASALRWRHYDPKAKPLGKLMVAESYNTRLRITKETKAERPRAVPVTPLLAALLAEWKLSGWRERVKHVNGMDRPPGPDDIIVPSRLGTNRRVDHALQMFHRDLRRLKSDAHPEGLRRRRQHDARRTWLSAVLAAGANETHAKWIAHGPPPTVLGHYMTIPWTTLCGVVDGLTLPKEAHG